MGCKEQQSLQGENHVEGDMAVFVLQVEACIDVELCAGLGNGEQTCKNAGDLHEERKGFLGGANDQDHVGH